VDWGIAALAIAPITNGDSPIMIETIINMTMAQSAIE
jgi:hypothetical protein